MEQRKHQFFIFSIILLIIGFLQYFRKIASGYKLSKTGKILYLSTMVSFVVGMMVVLYFTELNNILSFLLGLLVTTMSEHIAKLFLSLGDNFNPIIVKIINKIFSIDLTDEIGKKTARKEDEECCDESDEPIQDKKK